MPRTYDDPPQTRRDCPGVSPPLYTFRPGFAKIFLMKLVQFWRPNLGYRVGLVRGENVTDITMPDAGLKSTNDFIEHAAVGALGLAEFVESQLSATPRAVYAWHELDVSRDVFEPHLALPIIPPEVWAAGRTYAISSESREAESGPGILAPTGRPEIFFKATGSRCVGPNSPIGVRRDSTFTVPEPELALVIGHRRDIVAYTIATDVTACDIRMENPLYLEQSKVFRGSCALGPALATADEMGDPYNVEVRCRIVRSGETVFEDAFNTTRLRRRFDDLLDYLLRDNPVPGGSVLCTGTGIAFPTSAALEDGDLVEIEIPPIGVLRNPVKRWGDHGDA
jgi:2-dehydro-3-deoxy-D-arabinonate dehydratase